jgi:hypothetical protein
LLKDQLKEFFRDLDPTIQQLLYQVIDLEQQHISKERPRLQKELDEILGIIAQKELAKVQPEQLQTEE